MSWFGPSLGHASITNSHLITAMQDRGFAPELRISNRHPVIRINNKSFVFDAQRRSPHVLLHHGTTMMDKERLMELFTALNATEKKKEDIMFGMAWPNDLQEMRNSTLARSYPRRLAPEGFMVKDLTSKEHRLARQLYKSFYSREEAISFGKKRYGICYLPSTQYNMEEYAFREQ